MLTRLVQFLIVLIPVGLFGWLLMNDINPSGTFVVQYEMGDISPYVDRILPDERVTGIDVANGDRFVTVFDNPVYFSLHLPETDYETVDVELVFRNDEQPIVEIGPLVDVFSEGYDLRPVHNVLIDQSDWHRLESDGLTLLQRTEDFASISDFFDGLPNTERIATYHYDLGAPVRLEGYAPLRGEQTIDVSLRGYHQYVTYLKDEPFSLTATVMDMNRAIGKDDIEIRLRDEDGTVVGLVSLEDDGNELSDQTSSTREISLVEDGLPEGVYTVELTGTSDIVFRTLVTPQRYVTFENRLYIGDDVGYLPEPRATEFWTNAKDLTFETFHADATQLVTLGTDNVAITKSHQKVQAHVDDPDVVYGYTPAGDLKIAGDGKFAFRPEAFFDPHPVRLGPTTDLDTRGVDYILTEYQTPDEVDGWLVATNTFTVAEMIDEENDARFTISLPMIQTLQESVDVHAVRLTFRKDPLDRAGVMAAIRERLPFGL